MSEPTNGQPTVVVALAAVMEDVRAVRKADKNTTPGQGYLFRGIDAVMNAAGPAFRKHGIVVMPMLEEVAYRDVRTSQDKPSRECTVKVRYRFHGPAGDYLDCVTPGESMDFGDKGAAKAMSVAYRIALLQALCLPTDDTDPDAQSYERGESARPTSAAPPKLSPADEARQQLLNVCTAMELDPPAVAAVYEETHEGKKLKEETNAPLIAAYVIDIRTGKIPYDRIRVLKT